MAKTPVFADSDPVTEEFLEATFGRGAYFPTIRLGRINICHGAAWQDGKKLRDLPTCGDVRQFVKEIDERVKKISKKL